LLFLFISFVCVFLFSALVFSGKKTASEDAVFSF